MTLRERDAGSFHGLKRKEISRQLESPAMPAEEQRDKSGSFRKAETLGGKMGGGKITAENNLPSSRLLSYPLFSKNI